MVTNHIGHYMKSQRGQEDSLKWSANGIYGGTIPQRNYHSNMDSTFIFIFIMIFILIMIIMMMSAGCMSAPGTKDWREGSLCSSSFLLSLTYYTSYNTQIFIIGLLLLSLGWTTWGVYWMVRAVYRCRQKFYENLNHCDFETVYWIHYHYHGARRNSQKKSFASFFLFLCEHFRKAFVIFLKQL